jgi:hypothetical protein
LKKPARFSTIWLVAPTSFLSKLLGLNCGLAEWHVPHPSAL